MYFVPTSSWDSEILPQSVHTGWMPTGMSIFCFCSLFQYYRIFFSSPSFPPSPSSPRTPSITEDAAFVVSALYWPLNFFPKESNLIYNLLWCTNIQSCIILYLVNTKFYLLSSLDMAVLNLCMNLFYCFIFILLFHMRLGLLCIMI